MKAIATALIIALVGILLVGIQQYRVIALRGDGREAAGYT